MSTYWFGALALPERFLMLRSGLFGLIFLLASFAITPLVRLAKWGWAASLRRPLALYGFAFIVLHLYCYAVLENALNWELIGRDLAERPAMSAGVIAFLLLVPLVVTSTQGWQRRLGRRWKPLHRLIYVALPLSVLHFYWLERDLKSGPLFFAALVGLLLLLRVPAVRRGIGFTRRFLPSNRIYKNDQKDT